MQGLALIAELIGIGHLLHQRMLEGKGMLSLTELGKQQLGTLQPQQSLFQVAVDQTIVRTDAALGARTEVAFLPPMSGG